MIDIIIDTFLDALKLIPFLFIAFIIIELIEHKLSKKGINLIAKYKKVGPFFGGFLGIIPQCGFSVMATNLYATRIISLGTLISIYLSTSDEMLPIMLSSNISGNTIVKIILIKVFVGMFFGFLIDLLYRKKAIKNYSLCKEEKCHCENGIFKSSVVHTLKTMFFILLSTFIINVIFTYLGEQTLANIFMKNYIYGPFIISLIGLIPNCGSSIVITELFINNAISFGSCIGGLLTGSGVGLLILFKVNKNIKENLLIISTLYMIGSITGLIIELIA